MIPNSMIIQLVMLFLIFAILIVVAEIAMKAWRDDVKGLAIVLWIWFVFFLWQLFRVANVLTSIGP